MRINRNSLLVALFGLGLSFGISANEYGQGGSAGGAQQQQQGQQGGAGSYGGQGGAGAQGQGQGQPPQQDQAAANVDDESLGKFKDAFSEVNNIRESFASKLENVEDPEKAQKLQQKAQDEMVSAVEDADLSVEEYNQIFAAVQQDPELQKEVLGNN